MSAITRLTRWATRDQDQTTDSDPEAPQVPFDPSLHVVVTDALRHGTIAALCEALSNADALPYTKVDDRTRLISAPNGDVLVRIAGGYFADDALLVYSDFHVDDLTLAFNVAVGNNFVMGPAPGSSNGGDNKANAIITRGRDYDAFLENGGRFLGGVQHVPFGTPGYFKDGIRPDLDIMTLVLALILKASVPEPVTS